MAISLLLALSQSQLTKDKCPPVARRDKRRLVRQGAKSGRYLIQVDKQTKASYDTAEAAQSAALEIKKGYPIVKVSIFDSTESTNRLIELPSCELNG